MRRLGLITSENKTEETAMRIRASKLKVGDETLKGFVIASIEQAEPRDAEDNLYQEDTTHQERLEICAC